MRLGQVVLGGVIGGVLGAGAWVAIVHFTGYEVGFVAWGVGLLVGLGAMSMSGGNASALGGIMAGLIALVAVLGGKAGSAYLAADEIRAQLGMDGSLTKDMVISGIAEDVRDEFVEQGREMDERWPAGVLDDDDPRNFYPPQVWAEAERRWHEMPTTEQMAMRSHVEHKVEASSGVLFAAVFFSSFTLLDVIWLVLASMSAFKIASSGGEEEMTAQVVKTRGLPSPPKQAGSGKPMGAMSQGESEQGPTFLPMRKPDAQPHGAPLSRRSESEEEAGPERVGDGPTSAGMTRDEIEPAPPGILAPDAHADTPDLERGSSEDRRAA